MSHNLLRRMRETEASIYCIFFIYGKQKRIPREQAEDKDPTVVIF